MLVVAHQCGGKFAIPAPASSPPMSFISPGARQNTSPSSRLCNSRFLGSGAGTQDRHHPGHRNPDMVFRGYARDLLRFLRRALRGGTRVDASSGDSGDARSICPMGTGAVGASRDASHPSIGRGAQYFQQLTCANCHIIRGTSAAARISPDLTHVAPRETLAAGQIHSFIDLRWSIVNTTDLSGGYSIFGVPSVTDGGP
jgi:hypothetical protein